MLIFSQSKEEQKQLLLNDESTDEIDAVTVIFDDKVFPAFTVKVVATEKQDDKESITCHCSEKSFVGTSEVQEWKVELDDGLPEVDEPPSSSTTPDGSIASPESVTNHLAMSLSEHVPPIDSVTQYSLSETTNVEVSYTFHLNPSKQH